MSYFNNGNAILEPTKNTTIAFATREGGAEIIVKALNYFFEADKYTKNQAVEMMHNNAAFVLKNIADFVEKEKYSSIEIVEYLRSVYDELKAQALVVAMRDELKFSSPERQTE